MPLVASVSGRSYHGADYFGEISCGSAADNPAQHRLHARSPQVLQVSFVAVADARVSGTLEPYLAPDCQCVVHTTFTGSISGDVVKGTFVTRVPGGAEQGGRWKVMRQ
jgi:hypothetical protein